MLRLAAVEAALVGVTGTLAGLAVGAAVSRTAFPAGSGPVTGTAWVWTVAAALAGLLVAAATIVLPARHDLRHASVAATRRAEVTEARADRAPWWARLGIDVVLLAAGALLVLAASGNRYQLVVAPEGVATISVSYWAFAGPALLWIGFGLLVLRLADRALRRRRLVRGVVRPVGGALTPTAAALVVRRHRPVARAVALLGLALAFAVSTASFNATYRAQVEVDAQLTNGADVTVTEPPASRVGPDAAAALSAVPGVRAVEPVQHRFAYVGAELQDLYGVRPGSIGAVTALQDTYFQGGSAAALLDTLAAAPDSILVSAETVKDYQLKPGDPVNLRLRDGATRQLTTVPFRYAGIVTEFPTAPRDSFFVANAGYVAARTGSEAVGAFLVDTGGRDVTGVADRIRTFVGPTAT